MFFEKKSPKTLLKTSHFFLIYNENTKGSGKKRLISINNAAVIVNQTKATTGAVDKYVVKFFIKNFCLLLFQIFFFQEDFHFIVFMKRTI